MKKTSPLLFILFLFFCSSCITMLKQGKGPNPPEAWRSRKPEAKTSGPVKAVHFQKAVLKNGFTVFLAENHSLPITSTSLVVRSGSAYESATDAGLSELTFQLVDDGAGKYDALAFSQAFAQIGSALSINVGRDASQLSFSSTKKNLKRGIDLLSTAILKPRFEKMDFDRVKKLQLTSIKAQEANPTAIAFKTFYASAYGNDHPYGHPIIGTKKTVQSLSIDKVRNYWQNRIGPSNSALVIAGDVKMKEARKLAKKYFGKWKNQPKPQKFSSAIPERKQAVIQLVDRKKSPQTVLVVGRPLIQYGDPDLFTLQILNEIVGGAFTSRLNMNLREDKAWTYGVHSSVKPEKNMGPFYVTTSIQDPYAPLALKEIFSEFQQIRRDGVTNAEVETAKHSLILSLPGLFETNEAMNRAASKIFTYDLPVSYYSDWLKKIGEVKTEQVNRAANWALYQKQMTAIAVGQLEKMENEVRNLNLGEVGVDT